MSDDIGVRLGIVYRAGCPAPGIIAALPMATMSGRNPAILLVADGNGGELFKCALCGAVEGPRSLAIPTHIEPMTDRARDAAARFPGIVANLRARGLRVTRKAVCAALDGTDPKTLNDWIAKNWIPWPPP